MKRHVLHLLLLANAALALALAWLWFTPAGAMRNVHWQPPAAQKTDFATMLPALPGIATADTSQFIAMLDRPLFATTRRPPPPPPPPTEQAPVDNLSTARLTGVYQGASTGGIIINIAGKDRRVALSTAVDGWTLQSIQGRDVTFASAGRIRVLQLPRAALTTYTGLAKPPAALAPAAVAPSPAQPSARASEEVSPAATGTPSFGARRARARPSN